MNEFISPDEKAALAAFARTMYAESRKIDSEITEQPGYDGRAYLGSEAIRTAIERVDRGQIGGRSARPTWSSAPTQEYGQPPNNQQFDPSQYQPLPLEEIPQFIAPVFQPQQQLVAPLPSPNDGQMEFDFIKKNESEIISLLREISRKLTTLTNVIESTKNETKQRKPRNKNQSVSNVPEQLVKNQ